MLCHTWSWIFVVGWIHRVWCLSWWWCHCDHFYFKQYYRAGRKRRKNFQFKFNEIEKEKIQMFKHVNKFASLFEKCFRFLFIYIENIFGFRFIREISRAVATNSTPPQYWHFVDEFLPINPHGTYIHLPKFINNSK